MFDVMVESHAGAPSAGRRFALPVAVGLHGLAVGALIALSLLALESVSEPDGLLRREIFLGIRGFAVPALEGAGGASHQTPVPRPPVPPASPREVVQPIGVRTMPAPAEPAEIEIESGVLMDLPGFEGIPGLPPGVPWGVPWGDGTGPPHGGPGEGFGEGGGAARVEPVPVAPDMRPPGLIERVRPEYPAIALRARLEGHVVLQAVVGESGDVEDVEVLLASSDVFADPAIDAVRRWKYRPALQNGRPVRVYFTVRVEFRLE